MAGSNPPQDRAHPRVGGDDVTLGAQDGGGLGSSPRWRGRRPDRVQEGVVVGLIPALAGTTVRPGSTTGRPWAHPRVGGDDNPTSTAYGLFQGSSPRWRGRLDAVEHAEEVGRLIPALAGTTRSCSPTRTPRRAHPRVGGDDRGHHGTGRLRAGSSPRWRGRPARSAGRAAPGGLIPALAGTTSFDGLSKILAGAHPRVGGDDHFLQRDPVGAQGSSPRWRGRLGGVGGVCAAVGLIPALAGPTPTLSRCPRRRRAHPRVGGDDTFATVPPLEM